MVLLVRTEELFKEMLDKYDPELILNALDEMSRMGKKELIALGKSCEIINRAEEDKNHQP